MEKHYLASANTCLGFSNCFKSINPNKNCFTYILKGGPGTGKSTIIKNFAKDFLNKGYDVEYFYCSSDPNSLDGVRIVGKNIAIVDGTAPHITEATIPGIKEKIINVGEFINKTIKKHKKVIEKNLNKKNICFNLAYKYLKAISGIIEVENYESEINKISNLIKLEKYLSLTKQNKVGNKRNLFCSYITKNGVEFLYNKNKYKKIVYLNSNFFDNCKALSELEIKLTENNYNFISFLSVLNPQLTEGIFIEETKTLILSFNPKANITYLFKNKTVINYLLKKAGKYIEKARFYHKNVEKYYIFNTNFDNLNIYLKNNIEEYN